MQPSPTGQSRSGRPPALKSLRPLLRVVAIFATVGALFVILAGMIFANVAGGGLTWAISFLVIGLAFLSLGGYFVWSFYYLRRKGLPEREPEGASTMTRTPSGMPRTSRPGYALYAGWLGFTLLLVLGVLVGFASDERVGDVMSVIGLVGSSAFAIGIYLNRKSASRPPFHQ